jgi:acetoin utilization protein AcuC
MVQSSGSFIPNFLFAEEMMTYDFGPNHPLKPERLRRTVALLREEGVVVPVRPLPANREDLLRVHSDRYIDAVERGEANSSFGIGTTDNPWVEGIHDKALWYVGGAVEAARKVKDGDRLAINISGGLHHAMRDKASGFCIYNDPAIMISILRERFNRVAYVDIDVHHGDGVEAIYDSDPHVMTISIHESGRTLFPGTGFLSDTGEAGTNVNIPLQAKTSSDVWLWAFREIVPRAIDRFSPQAIVLQMGTDPHYLDPLGHLQVTAQDWVEAVRIVRDFGLPIAACGGGGYNLTTVPRMWAAACMTLARIEVPEKIPEGLQEPLGAIHYFDQEDNLPLQIGLQSAKEAVEFHMVNLRVLPRA